VFKKTKSSNVLVGDTETNKMNEKIKKVILPLIGKPCCRVKVWSYKSLSMGFGSKIFHNNPDLNCDYYGEWEIGTYYSNWRIVNNNRIIHSSNDLEESIESLDEKLNIIQFGNIISIENITGIDVRVHFPNELFVDFLALRRDEDRHFHIFCPNHIVVIFADEGTWKIEKSD
jgi:hypothetical protein